MANFKDIPISVAPQRIRSGEKYRTPQGFTAIKDGVKSLFLKATDYSPTK